MSEPAADSAGVPGEATGAAVATATTADSTPDLGATGQEQGDQSSKRINGLMSVLGTRTSERDVALAEIDTLKAQLAQREMEAVAEQPGQTQQQLMYPERYESEGDQGDGEAVDPMAPPEPPVITMGVNPSRGQNAPLGEAPVIGEASSPSVRYQQDQAQIAAMKRQLNAAGQQWVDQARESGLMD